MECREVEPYRKLMRHLFFVRLPLGIVGTICDHLPDLPIGKLHIGVFPLRVGSCPVEQLLVIVPFQICAAKTVECSPHMCSFRGPLARWLTIPLTISLNWDSGNPWKVSHLHKEGAADSNPVSLIIITVRKRTLRLVHSAYLQWGRSSVG